MKKTFFILFLCAYSFWVVAQTPNAHWNLTGNEQIDSLTHFLGTTDSNY